MNSEMWWHTNWWVILMAILATPIVASVLFALWLRSRKEVNLDTGSKCWDAFSKIIGAFTVIVTGAMLFGKYIEQQGTLNADRIRQERREHNLQQAAFLRQKLEFDVARHEKKRALFEETKTLVAHLAKTETPDSKSIDRFDQLYLSGLIGVEKMEGPVESAMVLFERKLRKTTDAPPDSLHELSLQLSVACEEELKESEDALVAQHEVIASVATSTGTQ